MTSYGQDEIDFKRFIDSANNYIDESSIKAQTFLDSILPPLELNIEGRLSEYYALKVLIQDDFKEYSKSHESHLLALKYAEKEKNYWIAGDSSLELFSSIYFSKRDSTAYKYLEKAEYYFKLSEFEYGPIEIKQAHEYVKFLDGEYEACNKSILENLNEYKSASEGYYYMFALYMLTSNYIYLEEFDLAHYYYNEFKSFENNDTVVKYNYLSFKVTIDVCFADIHFYNKQIDSTMHYLERAEDFQMYMGGDVQEDYFKLNARLYNYVGDIETYQAYVDSIMSFEDKMHKNALDANIEINDRLQQTEKDLAIQSKKKFNNRIINFFMFLALIVLSLVYLIYYRKSKFSLSKAEKEISNFSYLKSNNEKLTIKVLGFEEYLTNLKEEIKNISTINEVSTQREKITELYKNVHHNSTTLIDKSKNHLELINELNIDFFKHIQEQYPQLNNSEIIICYYLFIGFSNKEIAVFMNVSVRAIESKRYRICKKINLNNKETSLPNHLNQTFQVR